MARRLSSLLTLGLATSDKDHSLHPDSAGSPRTDSPSSASPPGSRPHSPAARLRKPVPGSTHSRAASTQYLAPGGPSLPSLQELKDNVALNGFNPVLTPPPPIAGGSHSRSSSVDRSGSRPGTSGSISHSRPGTPNLLHHGQRPVTPASPATNDKDKKKKRGLFGSSRRDKDEEKGPVGWIAGHPQKLPYDTDGLLNGQAMPELCDNNDGNCLVYLWPKSANKGASFKVDSAIFAASPVLTRLTFGDIYSDPAVSSGDRRQMSLDARTQRLSLTLTGPFFATPPATPPREPTSMGPTSSGPHDEYPEFSDNAKDAHLYLPINFDAGADPSAGKAGMVSDDLQTLVDIRNFFAFLCGQSLVATAKKTSFFQIFMTIAGILKSYEFSNMDGSTFGEVASSSFDNYVEELGLADVRSSREKTIEGIVLGERMRSIRLYNEAFTHGAGKHDELLALKSPKFELISPITQNRMIRATMDLDKRTASVRLILNDFDFPALFSGIMNSKMSEERKEGVRFLPWKDAFLGMRKYTMGLYQQRYGHWPPKARSKKNDLETSGLNRLVLRDVYKDMASMYDLLVDRNNLTPRTVDGRDLTFEKEEPIIRAIRAVLAEYDRSSPPVKPPVPFDLPRLPTLKTTRPDFGTGDKKKDAKAMSKKLKDDEIATILRASWNDDAVLTPFVQAFRDMEKRAAHGCTMLELVDLRIGQWIFMYVVLQALPMLACDATGIKHTGGVEYFLCEPPRSGVPWAHAHSTGLSGSGRTWFSVGDGGGVVSLPSDVVEHGVEGIYRRSHCWVMAEKWSTHNPILNEALHEQEALNAAQSAGLGDAALPPPPSRVLHASSSTSMLRPDSRGQSPNRLAAADRSKRNSYVGLGLEALPLPVGVAPDGRPASPALNGPGSRPRTPVHSVDASKTFDAILGTTGQPNAGKKGGKKK